MGVFFVVHGLKKQGFAALVFRGTNVSEAVCHDVFSLLRSAVSHSVGVRECRKAVDEKLCECQQGGV